MTTKAHPVWNVYDEYRTARMNVHIYEKQLSTLRRNNFVMESILALSVSSVIAGSWLWETSIGSIVWKIIITIAGFFAVLKPLLKFADQIQQETEILTSWRSLDAGLQKLVLSISQYRRYDDEMRNRFLTLMEAKSSIVTKEPPQAPSGRLITECEKQVNNELPQDSFFVPEV
jgi:hypothetical protein